MPLITETLSADHLKPVSLLCQLMNERLDFIIDINKTTTEHRIDYLD